MAKDPVDILSRLPSSLAWYLRFGMTEGSKRQKRRQFTANVFGLWGGLNSLLFSVYYLYHDLSLWPGSLVVIVLSLCCFLLPVSIRFGAVAGSAFASVTIGGCFVMLTFLFGTATGVFLYIFLVPAGVVLSTESRNTKALVLTVAICGMQLIYSVYSFPEPYLPAAAVAPFPDVMLVLAIALVLCMNAVPTFIGVFRAERAEDALEAEHARSEALLYNLLPEDIAARLKLEPDRTIADSLPNVAILFADIVNFTPRSAQMQPEDIVDFLNRIFTEFDHLAEKHGLEKIKTIGDAYMVAAGMPNPCGDPVHRIAEMALDMLKVTANLPDGVEVRIGLHAGPAVAGVIGNRKLFYDVWGETVNTASRMESHGEPGRIQVTQAAREALGDDFTFAPRGAVEVKGMGTVETWWLVGRT